MIEIRNLRKTYNGIVAVNNISFEVKKGEVFALLGPNGAGKTTTIKAILGLIKIDEGEVRINGIDVFSNEREAKKLIGYLPETPSFYENLTALQTLEFFAELRGVEKEKCVEILKEVGLGDAINRKVGGFSKGMIQRLGLAQCMMGSPSLLILDEPTSGLDALGAYEIRNRIRKMKEEGNTIVLSSHILSEVQELSDRVAIMNRGNIIAIDSVEKLSQKLKIQPKLKINILNPSEKILEAIKKVNGVEDIKIEGNIIEIKCSSETKASVINAIEDAGGKIIDFKTVEPTLEEIFVKMVKENE
ncbi:MAG: ABC transporter ATP-binding protein [Thermoplasmatales archaeon]|nr:ABC transporter ATP-binding protein [Thermoplasmatales archaeon]